MNAAIRLTAVAISFPGLLTSFAGPLLAQTPPVADTTAGSDRRADLDTIGTITVTGTKLKRVDTESVLPVEVIDESAMALRNALTPVDLLTSIPQVYNAPLNESVTGGLFPRGDNASINLRGIGAGNSLILLNGRRLAPNPQSAAGGLATYSVNVNQLPTQGIDRVEVLLDGASAVYGSDAVAGVVNYIMSDSFDGTDVRLKYGYPENGGGQSVQATLTHGTSFAQGRGHVLATVDYLHRDQIWLGDRSYSAEADHTLAAPPPWNVPGGAFDRRSATGIYPRFLVGSSPTTNYFRPVNGVPTLTTAAPSRATNPEYFFSANEFVSGSPEVERFNFFGSVEYDITDRIKLYSDVLYYRPESTLRRQTAAINAPGDLPALMSVDNPFNPYGSRFFDAAGAPNADGTPRLTGTPVPITLLTEVINSLPAHRTDKISTEVYRVVAGLKGDWAEKWQWDVGALSTRYSVQDTSSDNARESLMHAALQRTDSTAFNPFGYTFRVQGGQVVADQPFTNPESVLSTFAPKNGWKHDGESQIQSVDASASGPVLTIWSGDISLAVGAEYREEEFEDTRPPFVGLNPPESGLNPNDDDYIGNSPRPNTRGDRSISSAYAETAVPLAAPLNDVPLMEALEFTAAVRHEQYSDFGSTTKPKFGLDWRPWKFVMLRASVNRGFTAPSLPLLYQPTLTSFNAAGEFDPYRNAVTGEGIYVQQAISVGNPELQPSESEGKNFGVVLDVPGVRGLSVTADYWEVEESGVIGTRGPNEIKASDDILLTAYTQAQLAAGVPVGSIDAGSGTASYHGDRDVVRLPVAPADIAAFAAYNAANPTNQRATVGRIASYSQRYLNLSEALASGWDFGLRYHSGSLPFGRLSVDSNWTYLEESNTTTDVNGVARVSERRGVNGTPRWRGTTTIDWQSTDGAWSAGLSAYYIGSWGDFGATTNQATYDALGRPDYIVKVVDLGAVNYVFKVEDSLTLNANVAYRMQGTNWLSDLSIRLGVVNIEDEDPPLTPASTGYNSAVYGSGLAGRTWTLELAKKF